MDKKRKIILVVALAMLLGTSTLKLLFPILFNLVALAFCASLIVVGVVLIVEKSK